jgi:hypothetical protein
MLGEDEIMVNNLWEIRRIKNDEEREQKQKVGLRRLRW